jgi:hypothetical protein
MGGIQGDRPFLDNSVRIGDIESDDFEVTLRSKEAKNNDG